MKKNILRTSIISLMMFIISAIPVMAQTKKYSYDLVVGGSETKYVATKAGGSSFENKYYVTQDFVAQQLVRQDIFPIILAIKEIKYLTD